jgi:hypothetical protein
MQGSLYSFPERIGVDGLYDKVEGCKFQGLYGKVEMGLFAEKYDIKIQFAFFFELSQQVEAIGAF